ncbi:MAG: ATP-dependent DNA helicase [Saprospiraceae bacterium]
MRISGDHMESSLQHYNEAFKAFLDTLNPAQRRAVEATEGPVLVVAGPGTGKTHILTARIGNILLTTDARAQNVLCLTFTDAGANAMRRRLLERIGPEAHRVPIFTFHAFCNRVIQENMEHFGKGNLEPVTELERIEVVRNLLTKLPPEHSLREGKKDIFQYEEHLRDLFSLMKKEGWTPGFVLKKADEFLEELPTNPDFLYQRDTKKFKKGESKTAQVQEVTEKLTRLKAAADLYPKYLHAMERAGRYEYEDMLLWVTRAFEKNEALLRSYQERYQYILVDEFQDTNGAQFHLLNQLLDFWEVPNIFIVGDDDQSIYEFQGARLENLREFYQKYRNGLEVIVLEENYRSTQAILNSAKRVIENNELRAVNLFDEQLEKSLHASTNEQGESSVKIYPTRLHEVADIVFQIENLVKNGVAPSEIAVLYAKHRQANRLLTLLQKKGIPFQTKRPVNILDLLVIQQFRELLKYLHEESAKPFSGEHRLFRLLHAAWFGLEALDLAKIAVACRSGQNEEEENLYEKVGTRAEKGRRWREVLSDATLLNSLQLSHPESFNNISERLEGWISAVQNLPLSHFVERLFTQTGLLPWALNQPDKVLHLQILNSFSDFVQAESARNPRFSLARLLDLLDSMDDNKIALPLRHPPAGGGPGVQLLTAHSAKGLEFEHVFLFDCTDEAWEKGNGGNRSRFALPPTLTLSGEEDALEARRRLFYVAMTRAKRHLHISFAKTGDDGKALTQSQFVDETGLPQTEIAVPQAVLLETQTLLLLEPEQPVITLPEPDLLDELLSNFSLSITALNRYLRCPLAFYYEDLLKIPGATSEAAAFGTAMHGALQQFVLKMKSHKKLEWPSPENLQKFFAQEMERQRGWFSEHGFAQRLALGKDYLRRIHVEQVPFWKKRAIVERRFDRVELDGVPLTGIVDKIEWLDNGSLRLVDYKTGQPDPKKTASPDENQPYGGDYWRQLAFYKILLENAKIYPEPVGKTAISWLEPDRRGAFPITEISFSKEEVHFMENLIREVFSNIQNREFTTGCGKEDCAWCRMHRDRTISEVLERGEEEGLDDV